MGLTTDERIYALMDYRFTERQARFLERVLRHGGVCVPRQYASFAGIRHGGARCNEFFAKLVRRGYATGGTCVHNRARLFHVHSKRLYGAIGEPTSRYRRSMPPRLAIERLMWLDAVLVSPELDWLTTDAEKAAWLASQTVSNPGDSRPDAPTTVAPELRIDFTGTLPFGVDSSGRVVVFYLAAVPWTEDFRRFLHRHAAVLRIMPAWTLRLVFPRPIDRAYDAYATVIREELETPLQPATIRDLKRFFERRRAAGDRGLRSVTEALDTAGHAFAGPRFVHLYRRWLKHGDAAFGAVSSAATAEALTAGTGRKECLILPHTYRHLSPLVNRVDSPLERVEKGARGEKTPPHVLTAAQLRCGGITVERR